MIKEAAEDTTIRPVTSARGVVRGHYTYRGVEFVRDEANRGQEGYFRTFNKLGGRRVQAANRDDLREAIDRFINERSAVPA